MKETNLADSYDGMYQTPNYFRDRLWLYRPFVKALVAKAKLRPGARVLDAGCGQGFFTSLFAENGLNTLGVDISGVGISAATQAYGSARATFKAGDILQLNCRNEFDCVFTRSCSLYNSEMFEQEHSVTERLLSYLRENGVLVFDYYTKLNPRQRSENWIYHSMGNVQKHFSRYPGAEVYFSLRIEALLLGRFSLTPGVSRISAWFSCLTAVGGELVAIVRKRTLT